MAKSRIAKRRRDVRNSSKATKQKARRPEEIPPDTEIPENNHHVSPITDKPHQRDRNESHENALEDTPPNVDADIVFQCASCRAIVGDTLSEYQAHFEFETLSLRAASNVSVQKDLHVSKKGFDSGCTYRKVMCSSCGTHLGLSYQLGSSKTMEGHYAPNTERNEHDPEQQNNPEHTLGALTNQVSSEAFDALDAHVGSLTDATNKLTEAFNQNKESIAESKQSLDATNESLGDLRAGLEHVQNMMLLWDERFQRLDACEQGLAKLTTDSPRYDLFERRVTQLEEIFRGFARATAPAGRTQTTSMGILPSSLRKRSSSPATSSFKRKR